MFNIEETDRHNSTPNIRILHLLNGHPLHHTTVLLIQRHHSIQAEPDGMVNNSSIRANKGTYYR